MIQSPDFSQSYNRFTYCLNNPMLYIDPSGNSWLSNFGNWIGRNMGSILTGVYLAASVVACIVAPPFGGAMLGAYLGGFNANGGQLNAGAWNWKSASTWLGIGFGAAFGAIGAYGLANPGSIAMKLGYLAPGIGALGLTTNGNNFRLEWSTAAGGSGNYSLSGNQAPTAQQIVEREIAEARESAANVGGSPYWNSKVGSFPESDQFLQGFRLAVGDFYQNYTDMREANFIGADKYFHCKANFQAASRGLGGAYFAEHFSNFREIWDQNIKGYPRWDSVSDQEANLWGRDQVGKTLNTCKACEKYRPKGLPDKY